MVKIIENTEDYDCGSGMVYLTVANSRQMYSQILVKLDSQIIAYSPVIHNLALGDSNFLKGKKLMIRTDITDKNPNLEKTTSINQINDQTNSKNYEYSENTNNGDVVLFDTTINFI